MGLIDLASSNSLWRVGLSSLVDKNVLYIEGNGPSAKYKRK